MSAQPRTKGQNTESRAPEIFSSLKVFGHFDFFSVQDKHIPKINALAVTVTKELLILLLRKIK